MTNDNEPVKAVSSSDGTIKGGEVRPMLIPTTIRMNPPKPKNE